MTTRAKLVRNVRRRRVQALKQVEKRVHVLVSANSRDGRYDQACLERDILNDRIGRSH
jgi:hypothetical protein